MSAFFAFAIGSLACMTYPFVISSVTAKLVRLQELHRESVENRKLMLHSCHRYHVHPHIRMRVEQQMAMLARLRQQAKRNELLASLPQPLRGELIMAMRTKFVAKYVLFAYIHGGYYELFKGLCQRALEQVPVHRHERIFTSGEVRSCMLFVESGELKYVHGADEQHGNDSQRVTHAFSKRNGSSGVMDRAVSPESIDGDGSSLSARLSKGQWLSEGALFLKWRATGHVQAKAASVTLNADKTAVSDEILRFPEASREVSLYARHFLRCVILFQKTENCSDLTVCLDLN